MRKQKHTPCAPHSAHKWIPECRTLKEAADAFQDHFMPALVQMPRLLKSGNAEYFKLAANCLIMFDMIHPHLMKNPATGGVAFRLASELAGEIVALCQRNPPPAWLVEQIGTGYVVPWLMVNGKPMPGFPKGDTIVKRGKSRFDAPQTRNVAAVLCGVNRDRLLYKGDIESVCRGATPRHAAEYRAIAALPPLSRETRAQWWPIVKAAIQSRPCLSDKERQNIRRTLDHDTPAALMNEYLKRCKIAFDALCPAE